MSLVVQGVMPSHLLGACQPPWLLCGGEHGESGTENCGSDRSLKGKWRLDSFPGRGRRVQAFAVDSLLPSCLPSTVPGGAKFSEVLEWGLHCPGVQDHEEGEVHLCVELSDHNGERCRNCPCGVRPATAAHQLSPQ